MALSLLGPATAPFPTTVFDNTGPADGTLPTLAGIIRTNHAHRDYVITGLGGVADTVNYIDGGNRLGAEIRLRIADAAAPITFDPGNALSNIDIAEPVVLRAITEWLHLMRGADGWNVVGLDSEAEVVGTATIDADNDEITVGASDLIDVTITGGPWVGVRLSAGTVNRQRVGIRNTSATAPIQFHRTEATSRVDGTVERYVLLPNGIQYFEWSTTSSRWFPVGHEELSGSVDVVDGAAFNINPTNAGLVRCTPAAARTSVTITAGVFDQQMFVLSNVATAFQFSFHTTEATSRVAGSALRNVVLPGFCGVLVWDAAAAAGVGRWRVAGSVFDGVADTVIAAGTMDAFTPVTLADMTAGGGTVNLPDGIYLGQRKLVRQTSANSAVVTPTGATRFVIGSNVALASITLTASGNFLDLEWNGTGWAVNAYGLDPETVIAAGTTNALTPVSLVDISAGGGVVTLAAGLFEGQEKSVRVSATAGTNTAAITPASAFVVEGATVASLTLAAVGDFGNFKWSNAAWIITSFGSDADVVPDTAALSLSTKTSHLVTTAAATPTLANGYEGQLKHVVMVTDAGNATLTPASPALDYATIVFSQVGHSALLLFKNSRWHFLGGTAHKVQTAQTLTGAGAVSLDTLVTWIVTTGANALTLADGVEGQRKILHLASLGGAGQEATLTPTNLANGTAILFNLVEQTSELLFTDGAWHVTGGDAPVTVCNPVGVAQIRAGAGAVDLTHPVTYVESTGVNALTLADGTLHQRKTIVMTIDNGDATLTPTNLLGVLSTIAFNDVGDAVELMFVSGTGGGAAAGWAIISNQGCTLA